MRSERSVVQSGLRKRSGLLGAVSTEDGGYCRGATHVHFFDLSTSFYLMLHS